MKKATSKKPPSLDQIKQNIFNAKTDQEKKMWENILRKLNGTKKN